ncbi:hypothetical protein [Thermoactinomyces mirandus]|uniref:Uncharacterized protein n=1 Tax=Thermoactinomyces mirandus TaxID=2756294 RepID=A0A7W2AQL8_9BACL|nr:hypothetical protein [Thermoactinomyces mirandus]MBA4601643.1 hypothetical protein [Thermoactinomyces mirandus]
MHKLVENPGNYQLKEFDSDEVVLSVPAGGTYQLIRRHLIHAHPNHRNYSYSKLKHLITFRQAGGGRMDAIYYIDSTFVIIPDLLLHNPRPKKNNAGHHYDQLGNLLDGKEYV